MPNETQTAIESVDRAREAVERRLWAESSDYRQLKALEKIVAELREAVADMLRPVRAEPTPVPQHIVMVAEPGSYQISGRPLTQGDASERALSVSKEPLYLYDLLDRVRALGVTVTGKRPHINLSSTLSRDPRFKNIKYQGRYCWGLADRTYEGEEASKKMEDLLG